MLTIRALTVLQTRIDQEQDATALVRLAALWLKLFARIRKQATR